MDNINFKDSLILDMHGARTKVPRSMIKEIENGKALTFTGRWYGIICDCEENNDFDYQPAEPENDVPEAHKICNICNRVHYE